MEQFYTGMVNFTDDVITSPFTYFTGGLLAAASLRRSIIQRTARCKTLVGKTIYKTGEHYYVSNAPYVKLCSSNAKFVYFPPENATFVRAAKIDNSSDIIYKVSTPLTEYYEYKGSAAANPKVLAQNLNKQYMIWAILLFMLGLWMSALNANRKYTVTEKKYY